MSLEEELKADNFIIISNSLLLEACHSYLQLVPIVCNPTSLQFISITKLMQAQLEDAGSVLQACNVGTSENTSK